MHGNPRRRHGTAFPWPAVTTCRVLVTLVVAINHGGGNRLVADPFLVAATAATPPIVAAAADTARLYDETYRPQFHFSARENWHNDPNGLVFFGGEYHLFFQHNPRSRDWGNMTWGHAVSRDLVRWRQLDHALHPDRLGTMFSGSAVVDWKNTGGFQKGSEPALVALYTAAGGTSEESKGQRFTQCLAYSNDRGRTWTKYDGNPVLANVGEGDRDPKVFWHTPSARWIMPLYVGEKDPVARDAKGKPVVHHACHFYTSTDLKAWQFASRFAEPLYECPGLVQLRIEGTPDESRWVLWGASGDYWIGRFDGREFKAESPKIRGDYGANFYAAQAFDDLPDHRVVLISWMNGGKYPGMPFNQQMGFPVVLSLRKTPDGLRLVKTPVAEIASLVAGETTLAPQSLGPAGNPLAGFEAELADIDLEIEPAGAPEITVQLRGAGLRWDAKTAQLEGFGRKAPLAPIQGRLRLRALVDRTSIELFGNDGVVTLSQCFLPKPDDRHFALVATGTEARLVGGRARRLGSSWTPR